MKDSFFNNMKRRLLGRSSKEGRFVGPQADQPTVSAAIDFTITRYGETLKDLARYDRGEQLSR